MLRVSPAVLSDKQALRKEVQKKADGRLGGLSRNEFALTFRQSTMINHVLYYLQLLLPSVFLFFWSQHTRAYISLGLS